MKIRPIIFWSALISSAAFAQTVNLNALEKSVGGRIGVVAFDTGSGKILLRARANERFLMCSTFKLLVVAQVLSRVDAGKESLSRVIPYGENDLLAYAPITKRHVAEKGMSVEDLSVAALQYSDNTAANLLLATLGGPSGLTKFLRSIGDSVTRLDRKEPELNAVAKNPDFDTTTPEAMSKTLQKLVLGDVLKPASRKTFENWLLGNTTGDARLKAGLPAGWTIADKTGTGSAGATNDIGILYPPQGAPIVIAAYLSGSKSKRADLEAALAEIAKKATH